MEQEMDSNNRETRRSARLEQFLVFIAGLYLVKYLGVERIQIWLPALAGAGLLCFAWLLTLVTPNRTKNRLFYGIWWIGLLCLASSRLIAIFLPPLPLE